MTDRTDRRQVSTPLPDPIPQPSLRPAEGEYRTALDRLLGQIDGLPAEQRAGLRDAADAARQRHRQMTRTVEKLQETLDFLRLGVKYLVFDVEATRRENAYLKRQLDAADGRD